MDSTPESPLSQRDQQGLRGPARLCVEEATYPVSAAADGSLNPERKTHHSTEYDIEGRIVETRWRNPDGSEWVTHHTYNASGQSLKTTRGVEGRPPAESVYRYDDQGRPISITHSESPDNPVIFHYDGNGRKTKVQYSRPEDYRPNVATAANSLFEAADTPPNLEGGGAATTIYDEHDRPTEIHVCDSQGELVRRAVRIYDDEGRIAEEKLIYDDIVTMLSASTRASILETPGESIEDLREQLTKLMGGQAGPCSLSYSYDSQGRVTGKIRRVFNEVRNIEIACNQHGDPTVEITRTTRGGNQEEYSEAHYDYQYDDRNNWTEKLDSHCSIPGGTLVHSYKTCRKLTYF